MAKWHNKNDHFIEDSMKEHDVEPQEEQENEGNDHDYDDIDREFYIEAGGDA